MAHRSGTLARWLGMGVGTVGGFVLGYAMVVSYNIHPGSRVIIALTTTIGLVFSYLAVPYVVTAARRIDRGLKTTPLPDLAAAILGTIVGLVVAVLIGYFVRAFPFGVALSAVLALLLGAVGGSLSRHRRSELFALLAGAEHHSKEEQSRIRAALVDTSVIIDGRILELARTGFIDFKLVVPRFVLKELQQVADSADPIRRARGRRGLDVLGQVQKEGEVLIEFSEDDSEGPPEVDAKLVRLARRSSWAIFTNDFNLNRVATLEGIKVLNLNELSGALRVVAVPGEELTVSVVREGKEPGQGVAYLDDGTMVVIENGRRHLNQTISATVTSVLQTASGRMIFALPSGASGRKPRAESLTQAG